MSKHIFIEDIEDSQKEWLSNLDEIAYIEFMIEWEEELQQFELHMYDENILDDEDWYHSD